MLRDTVADREKREAEGLEWMSRVHFLKGEEGPPEGGVEKALNAKKPTAKRIVFPLEKAQGRATSTGQKVKPSEVDPKIRSKMKSGAYFTSDEMKKHSLVWRTTEDGRHIMVKDLGDDEGVVVGGAKGTMNFTRVKLERGERTEEKPKKPDRSGELSEEQRGEAEEKKHTLATQRKELKRQSQEQLETALKEKGLYQVAEKDLSDLRQQVDDYAKREGLSEEAKQELQVDAEKQLQTTHREMIRHLSDEATKQAIKKHAHEHQTGTPHEAAEVSGKEIAERILEGAKKEGRDKRTLEQLETYLAKKLPEKIEFTTEQSEALVRTHVDRMEVQRQERVLKQALKRGDVKTMQAVETDLRELSPEEYHAHAADIDREREEMLTNLALVETVEGKAGEGGVAPTLRHEQMHAGFADGAAAIGADLAGETWLDRDLVKAMGGQVAAQVVAATLREKFGADTKKANAALREHIQTNSSATAAAAMKRYHELMDQADQYGAFADQEKDLLTKQQARGLGLRAVNEAKRLVARSLGSLEMAAQVAQALEGKPQAITIGGRGTEAGTRDKAEKVLGLGRDDYEIATTEGTYEIQVKPEALLKLANPRPNQTPERMSEIARLKQWGQSQENADPDTGEEFIARGQADNISLSAPQAADIQMWEQSSNLLITDEAGLGKTAVSILGITNLKEQGKLNRALMIVPLSVQEQFGGEIDKFTEEKYHGDYVVVKDRAGLKKALAGDKTFVIISRDRVERQLFDIQEAAEEGRFDAMVVDEAHDFIIGGGTERDPATGKVTRGSGRAQALREVMEKTDYNMMMTATPIRGDLTEIHSLVDALSPGRLGTVKQFKEQYAGLAKRRGLFDQSLLTRLQRQIDDVVVGFSLHVDKGGKLVIENAKNRSGNPVELQEETIWVDPHEAQEEQLRQNNKGYLQVKNDPDINAGIAALTKHRLDYEVVNSGKPGENAKVAPVRDWLQREGYPQKKAIIFAESPRHLRSTVIPGMGDDPQKAVVIDGSVSESWQRNAIAKWYNQREDKPLTKKEQSFIKRQGWNVNSPPSMLYCTDAANYGMNLYGGSLMVQWDTPKQAAIPVQRRGRQWRTGQEEPEVKVLHIRTNTPHERRSVENLEGKSTTAKVGETLRHGAESGLYEIAKKHLG